MSMLDYEILTPDARQVADDIVTIGAIVAGSHIYQKSSAERETMEKWAIQHSRRTQIPICETRCESVALFRFLLRICV